MASGSRGPPRVRGDRDRLDLARRVLVGALLAGAGLVLLWFGRLTSDGEDAAGVAWSLLAVLVTIGAAGSAGGLDPAAVRTWVSGRRLALGLLVAPALVSWALVALGVRPWAWLTDPTPVAALGLGLVLAAVPLSRGPRPRPRSTRS